MTAFWWSIGSLVVGGLVGFVAGLIYVGDGDDDEDDSIPW